MPIAAYTICPADSEHWYFIFYFQDGDIYESDYYPTRIECLKAAQRYVAMHKGEFNG